MTIKNVDERVAVLNDTCRLPAFYVYENGKLLESSAFFKKEDIILQDNYQTVYATYFKGRLYVYARDSYCEPRVFFRLVDMRSRRVHLEDLQGKIWDVFLKRIDPFLHETEVHFSMLS